MSKSKNKNIKVRDLNPKKDAKGGGGKGTTGASTGGTLSGAGKGTTGATTGGSLSGSPLG